MLIKSIFLKCFSVCLFILISFGCYSQKNETVKDSLNGLEFYYNWKDSNCFHKKKPLQLNVKVKNTNTYSVKLQFQVNYYQSGIIIEQSDTINLCLNPNQSKNGSKNGLNFSAEHFTRDDINKPSFTLEIHPIQIIKMRSCQ